MTPRARPAMRWHAAPRNVTAFEKVSLIHRKVTASDRDLARDFSDSFLQHCDKMSQSKSLTRICGQEYN